MKEKIKQVIGAKCAYDLSTVYHSMNVAKNRYLRRLGNISSESILKDYKMEKYKVCDHETFFGYYDLTPFSKNNKIILGMAGLKKNRLATANDIIQVGYFNRFDNKGFKAFGETSTWCWQMGCRLQWYPENENELVIYNKMVGQNYGSVVQNINTGKIEKTYNIPIYQIDKKCKYAITLNFSRLHRLRPGYGYRNIEDKTRNDPHPEGDGIWLVDLETGKNNLIISLGELVRIDPKDSMNGAEHYINHLAFNPSGNRFMFFHLWLKNRRRYNRLITCDRDGENLWILEEKGTTSHYSWKTDSTLLATVFNEGIGDRYYVYEDKTNKKHSIAWNDLRADGHPSYSPNSDNIITDTSPDKYRDQWLILLSEKEEVTILKKLFSPAGYRGEIRCDLHPRWDRYGECVCIDSAHENSRAIYVVSLS